MLLVSQMVPVVSFFPKRFIACLSWSLPKPSLSFKGWLLDSKTLNRSLRCLLVAFKFNYCTMYINQLIISCCNFLTPHCILLLVGDKNMSIHSFHRTQAVDPLRKPSPMKLCKQSLKQMLCAVVVTSLADAENLVDWSIFILPSWGSDSGAFILDGSAPA